MAQTDSYVKMCPAVAEWKDFWQSGLWRTNGLNCLTGVWQKLKVSTIHLIRPSFICIIVIVISLFVNSNLNSYSLIYHYASIRKFPSLDLTGVWIMLCAQVQPAVLCIWGGEVQLPGDQALAGGQSGPYRYSCSYNLVLYAICLGYDSILIPTIWTKNYFSYKSLHSTFGYWCFNVFTPSCFWIHIFHCFPSPDRLQSAAGQRSLCLVSGHSGERRLSASPRVQTS